MRAVILMSQSTLHYGHLNVHASEVIFHWIDNTSLEQSKQKPYM